MGRKDIDFDIVEEPCILGNRFRGLKSRNLILISPQVIGKISVIAWNDSNLTMIPRYSDEDVTVVSLERQTNQYW